MTGAITAGNPSVAAFAPRRLARQYYRCTTVQWE
jgi:hypothetical protein